MFLLINLNKQDGLTLVELLVVLVLSSLVVISATSLVVKAIDNNKKIALDTMVRDTADILMSAAVREIYTLPDSKIDSVQKKNHTLNGTSVEESYLVYDHNGADTFTGFKFNSTSKELEFFIRGQLIPISNNKIKINHDSNIEHSFQHSNGAPDATSQKNNVYRVTLILNYEVRGDEKELKFENEITTIRDE